MNAEEILKHLLEILEKQEITVKYDRGNFKGGLVKYNQQELLYLNRKEDFEERIKLVLSELQENHNLREILPAEFYQHVISYIDK